MTIQQIRQWSPLLAAVGLLAGCGGSSSSSQTITSNGYAPTALVSDVAAIPARYQDSKLVNPWGLAFGPSGAVWIANNGSQTSTLYDGNGLAESLVVSLPAGSNGAADPTGIVYNGGSGFVVSSGAQSAPAVFIYDGEGGTLAGWSASTGNTAITAYDDGSGGAVYKGLALASNGGASYLYAADFHNAKVDVFDSGFHKVTSAGGFTDPNLPAGYAPFGIQALQGNLFISYAEQQTPDRHDEVDGAGLGYVNEFDTAGHLLQRLVSGGALNAPWGLVQAPANFGAYSGALLVGNFGDGRINAYNISNGAYLGTLATPAGATIVLPGLWGLAFGNGADNQPTNTLFYTAGTNNEADGTYGRIDTQTVNTTTGGGGY